MSRPHHPTAEEIHNFNPKTEDEYLQTRVLDQINWFEKKAALIKNGFYE